MLSLSKKGERGAKIPIDMVVTGVKEEDKDIIHRLNRKDVRRALDIPEDLNLTMITEKEIEGRAELIGETDINIKDRVGIVKDLYLEALGRQKLLAGEYIAIVTDSVTEEESQAVEDELKKELQDNISIWLLVGDSPQIDRFSLSDILNDWLKSLKDKRSSTISRILPRIISSDEMMRRLDAAVREVWRVLTAA